MRQRRTARLRTFRCHAGDISAMARFPLVEFSEADGCPVCAVRERFLTRRFSRYFS